MTDQEYLQHLNDLNQSGQLIGRFSGIPNEVYHHKDCPGISATRLGHVARSIDHYLHSFVEREKSEALEFGSAFHDAILLPNLFAEKYIISQKFGRTNEEKAKAAAFKETNKGKTILDQDDFDRIAAMIEKIKSVDALNYVLANGEPEVTFFWRDPFTNVLCKCRVDWLFEGSDRTIIVDFKTTKDASKEKFSRSIVDYNYHRTGAFYLDGVSRCLHTHVSTFAFVAIESKPPHETNLFCLGNKSISVGRAMYNDALQKYKDYIDNKDKYHEQKRARGFEEIEVPYWALNIEDRG